jgi:hypothetical protein
MVNQVTKKQGKNHFTPLPEGVNPNGSIKFVPKKNIAWRIGTKYNVTDEEKRLAVTCVSGGEFATKYLELHKGKCDPQRLSAVWAARTSYMKEIEAQKPILRGIKTEPASGGESLPDMETLLKQMINQNEIIISYLRDSFNTQKLTYELFKGKMTAAPSADVAAPKSG